MKAYELHPICAAYPTMSDEELQRLGEDLLVRGVLIPLWLLDGKLLDGRNRYYAAQKVGYEIPEDRFRVFNPETQGSPVDFVVALNERRRQLTKGQKVHVYRVLREQDALWRKRGRPKKEDDEKVAESTTILPAHKRKARAQAASRVEDFSEDSAKKADYMAAHAPDILAEVEADTKSIDRGYKEAKQRVSPKAPKADTSVAVAIPTATAAVDEAVDEVVDEAAGAVDDVSPAVQFEVVENGARGKQFHYTPRPEGKQEQLAQKEQWREDLTDLYERLLPTVREFSYECTSKTGRYYRALNELPESTYFRDDLRDSLDTLTHVMQSIKKHIVEFR